MSADERKEQAVSWIAAAKQHDISVIVHVGAESMQDSIELAAHAQAHGAHAIGAMPSVFFKPPTVQALA